MALMRLYLARGYPAEARRVYHEWEVLVREDLSTVPSRTMQQMAQQVEASARYTRHCARMLCESGLPSSPAGLLGRERETANLTELLRANPTRLVTITGEGGIGKTSLAIEVARRLVGKGQRVWFVEVADVREGHALLEHILRTIGAAPVATQLMQMAIQALGGYPSFGSWAPAVRAPGTCRVS